MSVASRQSPEHQRGATGPARRRRRGVKLAAVLAPALLLTGLLAAIPDARAAADTGPGGAATTKGTFADPDMIQAGGDFYAYATSSGNPKGCRYTGHKGRKSYVVPVIRSSGESGVPQLGGCPTGDALARPSTKLVAADSGIWAPSVVQAGPKKFFMYYSATKAGTKQKCIFRATANSAAGTFDNSREFACPPAGRWAIDPDAYRADDGTLYLAYRDDAPVKFPETALSAVKLNKQGFAKWDTRVTLATSEDITWDTEGTRRGATSVIENPSIVQYRGHFLVSYSGNDWTTARYGTGLLDCGANLLGGSKCVQKSGPRQPYFGHRAKGMDARHGLPGNPDGPGGMSLFRADSGRTYAIYHHLVNLPDTRRKSVVGEFAHRPADGAGSITAVRGR